jgi:hypothetical protein
MNAAAERATIILDIETSWYSAQPAVALYQLVPNGADVRIGFYSSPALGRWVFSEPMTASISGPWFL